MKAVFTFFKSTAIGKILQYGILIYLAFFLSDTIIFKGYIFPFMLAAIPIGIGVVYAMFANPRIGFFAAFGAAFIVNGLGRYISAPFGLTLDFILLAILVTAIFSLNGKEWSRIKSAVVGLTFIWFLFTVFEIFNPEAVSFEAWFYAVRGISFYMIFLIPLTLLLFRREKDLQNMFTIWFIGGIISSFYGMKQLFLGLDDYETYWLYSGAAETHLLFGRLRIFSFYSDAGQFGAFMAFTGVVATILALKKMEWGRRIFYAFTAIVCFYGMMISGTRGALFIPLTGFFIYLLMSKNFKIFILGSIMLGAVFCVLKFTFAGQGIYQIQRMRSALNPDDPSFQVRLENQRKFKEYLSTRPFGGGIGSAGYWGLRFSPNTFLAETPTDSHYVRIWAETGIVGLIVHIVVLISILGISFFRIFKIKNPEVKQKMMALYAGCFGIIVASYGNQVMAQMPTNVFFYISLAFLFIGPEWDKRKEEELELQ